MSKSTRVYGFENGRFFVPASNPHGHRTWFPSRIERDLAVERLEAAAAEKGLDDPTFARIERRIRTESARSWLDRLRENGLLLANGIDGPTNRPSHSWGPAAPDADEEE